MAEPSPDEGDVLLDLHCCGICGSDMHAWAGHDERRPAPLILGHEAAGTGPDGRRWTINPLVTCGECEACRTGRDNICQSRQIISMPPREGAFAERLAMPVRNLVEVPAGVSFEAAALTEPLACGWHAVRLARQAQPKPLEEATCLSIGGGAIGLGAALALLANGAKEVWLAETSPARRLAIEGIEGLRLFDPTTDNAPEADVVIDGVGFEATRALASAAPVVVMDDPMRGVDVGTKQDVYAMIRAEADRGRTFLWYSTETEEVCQCDRIFVFRDDQISAELTGEMITEERILEASFEMQEVTA